MTTQLLFKAGKRVLAGTLPSGFKTQIESYFTTAGWQVLPSSTATTLDLLPPAAESVGNSLGEEVLRIEFNNLDVKLGYAFRVTSEQKSQYALYVNTYTNNETSFMMGTQAINAPTKAPNSDEATEKLYNFLVASTDSLLTKYDYSMQHFGVNTSKRLYVVMTEKASGTTVTPTQEYRGSIQVSQMAEGCAAGAVVDRDPSIGNTKIPVNYGQDWAFYLSINARSVQLAARTSEGIYGPVAAEWINHNDALAQCPEDCCLSELCFIDLSPLAMTKHAFFGSCYGLAADSVGHSFGRGYLQGLLRRSKTIDYWTHYESFTDHTESPSSALMGGTADDRKRNPKITIANHLVFSGNRTYSSRDSSHAPCGILEDCLGYFNAGGQELTTATHSGVHTTLATNIDATATTIQVADASKLEDIGTIMIDDEVINYASKSGNTLSGCKRHQSATVAAAHTSGAVVHKIFWYVRMNGGAMPAGYRDPAEIEGV